MYENKNTLDGINIRLDNKKEKVSKHEEHYKMKCPEKREF